MLDLFLREEPEKTPPSGRSGHLDFSDLYFLLETWGNLDETHLGKIWAGPREARGRKMLLRGQDRACLNWLRINTDHSCLPPTGSGRDGALGWPGWAGQLVCCGLVLTRSKSLGFCFLPSTKICRQHLIYLGHFVLLLEEERDCLLGVVPGRERVRKEQCPPPWLLSLHSSPGVRGCSHQRDKLFVERAQEGYKQSCFGVMGTGASVLGELVFSQLLAAQGLGLWEHQELPLAWTLASPQGPYSGRHGSEVGALLQAGL